MSKNVPFFLLQFLVQQEARSSAEEQEVLEVPGTQETIQTLGKWKSKHSREGQQNHHRAEGHLRMSVINSETLGSDSDNSKHAVCHIVQAPF